MTGGQYDRFEAMKSSLRIPSHHWRMAGVGAFIVAILFPQYGNTSPMAVQRKVAKPNEVKVTAATVTLHTTDDDKEKDTAASLYIKMNDGTVVALIENIKSYFKNNATSTVKLKIVTPIPKSSIQGCTATVKTTRLKGHDAWQFYYEIEFAFSDRSRMKKSCSPVVIGENDLKVCPL